VVRMAGKKFYKEMEKYSDKNYGCLKIYTFVSSSELTWNIGMILIT
jgi:hypothetical protein